MGACVAKLPHSCGTREGLQVFADTETGKVDGYCFSCATYVANPYGEKRTIDEIELPEPKSKEQIDAEIAEVSGYPVVDAPTRRLRAADLDAFGVKVGLSEEDGKTPTTMYFPMTKDGSFSGYYVKTLSKPSNIWSLGDVKGADPFGWVEARRSGAYRLIITEGLEDAIAVKKIYKQYGKEDYQPAVISLPNGVNSIKSLNKIEADVKAKFREVVICFDDDEPGRVATEKALMVFPLAKSVKLPYKDANDCVIKGAAKAAFKALAFDAAVPKNTRLLSARQLHEVSRVATPYGELTWPWPTMNKLLRGIRYGETIYIGAGVKMGKSELVNALAAHFIKEHNVGVFLAKPEEDAKKSYKMICNKIAGSVFTDPDIEFDEEAFDEAGKVLEDKLFILDLYQHLGWDTLKRDIVSAAAEGAKAVFIDPITNLTNGHNAADANTELQSIAQELSALSKDLNIVSFVFCHLKAPEGNIGQEARAKKYRENQFIGLGNCPHERGGDVLSNQFAGSRAMMRSCNLMLGIEGNKDPELPEEIRMLRWINILEDREFGNAGRIKLQWNKHTTRFREV